MCYPSGGYTRRAAAIIPSEETLKERADGIPEADKHEELPKDLQNEMKAYLTIPVAPEQVAEVKECKEHWHFHVEYLCVTRIMPKFHHVAFWLPSPHLYVTL